MDVLSLPQSPGIYTITCLITGKFYVGAAINIQQRFFTHRRRLRKGIHENLYLQRAWDKYGEQNFKGDVLESVLPCSLVNREQYWLDKLKPFDECGYNLGRKAGMAMLGRKHSPESREKMSAVARLRKQTPETRAKLSELNKGKKLSPEHRTKLITSNIGRKATVEAIEKSAEARRKTYVIIAPDGSELVVKGLLKFCREHGLTASRMSSVANGNQDNHKGWKCRLAEV